MLLKKDKKLKCEIGICRKEFSSKKTLEFHQRITHGFNPKGLKITKYVCPFMNEECGEKGVFMYKTTRDRHVLTMHRGKELTDSKTASDTKECIDTKTGFDDAAINDTSSSHSNPVASLSEDADASGKSLLELITGFNHPRTRQQDCNGNGGKRKRKERHIACPASSNCLVRFSRLYDLKRHLRSAHPSCVEDDDS